MSSLRRDLIERRLWLVLALLVAAVAAVPFLMLHTGPQKGVAVALPPATPPVSVSNTPTASVVRIKALVSRIPRDPFANGSPHLTPVPSATPSPTVVASAPAASAGATATTTAAAAMVAPAPAASSSTSTTSTTTTTAPAAPQTTTASASTTATVASPTPPPTAEPAQAQTWTEYSVSLGIGKDLNAPMRNNVPRLAPLPWASQPHAMFMGVLSGGAQAVFALGAGVSHSGPGICRLNRTNCSAILLKQGQAETLTWTLNGAAHRMILRVGTISASQTQSHSDALAAYERHSDVGLCELDLASPVSYSSTTGLLSGVAAAACRGQRGAVPFASAVAGS